MPRYELSRGSNSHFLISSATYGDSTWQIAFPPVAPVKPKFSLSGFLADRFPRPSLRLFDVFFGLLGTACVAYFVAVWIPAIIRVVIHGGAR